VVLFWEITKACALACRHCRAEAQPRRHPQELSTSEALQVVDQIAQFSPKPILVISGGDPLMRRDLFQVIEYSVGLGIRTSLSPSVTALLTPASLTRVFQAGVRQISLSLDGATPETHDAFRGVQGSFARTLAAITAAKEAGLTVQVNTTVTRDTWQQLNAIADVVGERSVDLWDLFFLVPTGRARKEELLSAEEHEQAYQWLCALADSAPFRIKATLGQPFRRVQLQRALALGKQTGAIPSTNDGKGICFFSHTGDIYPSGFLPLVCGNVRRDSLVETYQAHEVFLTLRDSRLLKGKCGLCPFNQLCGGCRARAFALTGDYLAADPTCAYVPPQAAEGPCPEK
jgi:radical SAM protein with 4Fe4S-binding SPASM domain